MKVQEANNWLVAILGGYVANATSAHTWFLMTLVLMMTTTVLSFAPRSTLHAPHSTLQTSKDHCG